MGRFGELQQARACNGWQVQFCCDACWGKFQTNPEKYFAMLK
jgi:YHS domain-containing protein